MNIPCNLPVLLSLLLHSLPLFLFLPLVIYLLLLLFLLFFLSLLVRLSLLVLLSLRSHLIFLVVLCLRVGESAYPSISLFPLVLYFHLFLHLSFHLPFHLNQVLYSFLLLPLPLPILSTLLPLPFLPLLPLSLPRPP